MSLKFVYLAVGAGVASFLRKYAISLYFTHYLEVGFNIVD